MMFIITVDGEPKFNYLFNTLESAEEMRMKMARESMDEGLGVPDIRIWKCEEV